MDIEGMTTEDFPESTNSERGAAESKGKNVGYLITPRKQPYGKRPMSPDPSPPVSLTPLKRDSEWYRSRVSDEDYPIWFRDISLLSKYIKEGNVNLDKLNARIQELVVTDVYPTTGYLLRLMESERYEDKKVCGP
jgi:hypothetical protein